MSERSPGFEERFQRIQSELSKKSAPEASDVIPAAETPAPETTPAGDSPEAVREKLARYRELEQEEAGTLQEAAGIRGQLEQAQSVLGSVEKTPENQAAIDQLVALLEEMQTSLTGLDTAQRERRAVMDELMTPDVQRMMEQAAEMKAGSQRNIEQLEQLLAESGESLEPHRRLELLGHLYGLAPSTEHKQALAEQITAMVDNERYRSPQDLAGNALAAAINSSEQPPDIRSLIELIRPSEAYLRRQPEGSRPIFERAYEIARNDTYKRLAEKTIQSCIAEGRPEDAEQALADARAESAKYFFHSSDIAELNATILDLYVGQGKLDQARMLVESADYKGNRVTGYLTLFRKSGEAADLEKARADGQSSFDRHVNLYQETDKWQAIGAASGDPADSDKANAALQAMSREAGYMTEQVFDHYGRMHGLPGIDRAKLEQTLRDKAAAMDPLDQAKATLAIAGMSKNPDDSRLVQKRIDKLLTLSADELLAGKRDMFERHRVNDSAEAYGALLQELLEYDAADASHQTDADRALAEGLFRKFEQATSRGRENRAAYDIFGGLDNARELVTATFQTPDEFRGSLARSEPDTLWKLAVRRIDRYNSRRPLGGSSENRQQAIAEIADALSAKGDPEIVSKYLPDITWRFMNAAKTEADYRFLERLIDSHQREGVAPALENVREQLHRQLAVFSAGTSEADRHIAELQTPGVKGLALAEVAKRRRELSRAV